MLSEKRTDNELTAEEVAEVARRARSEGVIEPLVEAIERVAERIKRRELAPPLKPKEVKR